MNTKSCREERQHVFYIYFLVLHFIHFVISAQTRSFSVIKPVSPLETVILTESTFIYIKIFCFKSKFKQN